VKPLDSYFLSNEIHWVDPKILKPGKDNPRRSMKGDQERYEGLKESIRRGFFTPLLVEGSSQEIIAGHQRREAALDLKMKAVPVLFLKDLTRAEKVRIRATDNAAGGFWDLPMLTMQLAELPKEELPMIGLDAITLGVVEPLGQEEALPQDEDAKWRTFKVKMNSQSYEKAVAVVDLFCQREHCKAGTALERILEEWSQTPGNSPLDA
jgi:ParB-like nuclease domain